MTDRRVVNMHARTGYKPDIAALARNQVSAARAQLEATPQEFADILSPILGWQPTPEAIESWEATTVPPGDVLVAASLATHGGLHPADRDQRDMISRLMGNRFSDVDAVFTTRTEFTASVTPTDLFDQAKTISIAGISLNLICQSYPDRRLRQIVEDGTEVRCLFLDPSSEAIRVMEREERHPAGTLSALTELNIQVMTQRIRDRLTDEARDRLQVAIYDETPRFNIILTNDAHCVVQPYLPETRGVDSPTFVVERQWPNAGLFPVFEQVFTSLWNRSRPL